MGRGGKGIIPPVASSTPLEKIVPASPGDILSELIALLEFVQPKKLSTNCLLYVFYLNILSLVFRAYFVLVSFSFYSFPYLHFMRINMSLFVIAYCILFTF